MREVKSRRMKSALAGALGMIMFMGAGSTAKAFDWNGFFVGVHAGYAWSDVSGLHDQNDVDGPFDFSNIDLDGGVLGVQARYNFVVDRFLVGAEVDYSWADQSDNAQGPDAAPGENFYDVEHGDLWSVRARLGFFPLPNVLAYATAGWGGTDFSLRVDDNSGPASGAISFDETGAVYGGGIEVAVSEMVTIKTEYLYYDVGGSAALTNPPIPDSDAGDFIDFDDIQVWRVALNVKLGDLFGRRHALEPLK